MADGTSTLWFEVSSIFEDGNGGSVLLGDLDEAELSRSMSKRGDPFTYVAKYIAKQGGELHFGGTLEGVNFSEFIKSRNPYGRKEIVTSASMGRTFFHLNNPRRKK